MVEIVDKAESLIAYEVSLTQQSSFDDVAAAIIGESRRRGYTRDESIACVSTGIQESGLRPSAVSPNGLWRGIYQQDASYPGRDDPKENIWAFLDRLDVKRRSPGASPDIWLNIFWLQQRPGEPSADAAYRNGRGAYLTEIKRHSARAGELYDRLSADTPPADRPDYNEYPMWSPGTDYKFTAGTFYRVDADNVINDVKQSAFSGAHSDIRKPALAQLAVTAAAAHT